MRRENLFDAEIEQLWLEEAIRRDDEIDAGKVELRPAEDILREARARLS